MGFEFDPRKSESNKLKHGIDFVEAQRLWGDGGRIVVVASWLDEIRFLTIGVIDGKHWTAIWTGRSSAIRIISVRRARKEEVRLYNRGRA
jgi:uncharacterized DUF497 family protein